MHPWHTEQTCVCPPSPHTHCAWAQAARLAWLVYLRTECSLAACGGGWGDGACWQEGGEESFMEQMQRASRPCAIGLYRNVPYR